MTFRELVSLGLALSGLCCAPPVGAEEATAKRRPPVRTYTNEDLERVHSFRDQTGARSVPAVVSYGPATAADEKPRGHGEDYWRREAARVRERVRALEQQADSLRARVAEQAEQQRRFLRRGRASAASSSEATLRARLASIERRERGLEEDLADRARRDGALPGWLR